MRNTSSWGAWTLLVCAMSVGFAWFDMPGHGSAFAAQGELIATYLDGHSLFLMGMLAIVVLELAVPRWLERHCTAMLALSLAVGTASLVLYCAQVPPAAVAASVVATGFADVLFTTVAASTILTRLLDHEQTALAVIASLAVKTLFVYGADRFVGESGQTALLISMPAVCVACALAARRLLPATSETLGGTRVKFKRPLSGLMVGIMLVAAVIFAATRVVSNLGFWGTAYPLTDWPPLPSLAITAIYLFLCYFTLVKVDARLLFRFLPALLTLFALYAFLYSDLGGQLGLSREFASVLAQYAELYGQAFMWAVLLLGMRTLAVPPLRVIGILFGAFTFVELFLQYFLTVFNEASFGVVLFAFFAMFAVLIWALCRFYGKGGFEGELEGGVPRAVGASGAEAPPVDPAPVAANSPPAATQAQMRHALAARYGLSERETEVFLLLALGRTRRFICDELFISEGTASSYTGRVYEKLGVHSKQELLTFVLEQEAGATAQTAGSGGPEGERVRDGRVRTPEDPREDQPERDRPTGDAYGKAP